MRLLVLDDSPLLSWLIRHELAGEAEVEVVGDFECAERRLIERPPAAVVVNLPPAELPWRRFQHLCATRRPPVPVLYESCLFGTANGVGIDPADGYAAFLPKPATRAELGAALRDLLDHAAAPEGAEGPESAGVGGAERPADGS